VVLHKRVVTPVAVAVALAQQEEQCPVLVAQSAVVLVVLDY
jgi:hypothetical protein